MSRYVAKLILPGYFFVFMGMGCRSFRGGIFFAAYFLTTIYSLICLSYISIVISGCGYFVYILLNLLTVESE